MSYNNIYKKKTSRLIIGLDVFFYKIQNYVKE